MSDDKQNRGGPDRSRMNMHEDYEVRYWTETLGVSKERLAELVAQHGTSAAKVRAAIGK
jgi:uncharacterized protein DUF3606